MCPPGSETNFEETLALTWSVALTGGTATAAVGAYKPKPAEAVVETGV